MSALEPCPFCGAKAVVDSTPWPDFPFAVSVQHTPTCYLIISDAVFDNLPELEAAWNARATPDTLMGEDGRG